MARYEITGPDGGRYEVTAPDSMPEPAVLARFKAEVGYTAPAPAAEPQTWGDWGTGVARAAAQGFTGNFADEIEAWRNSRANNVPYEQELARIRAANAEFAAASPTTSTVAQIGGGVVPFALGPGAGLARLAIGRTLPRTVARSAGVGAGVGAVYGAGGAEGGLEERLSGAATGVAFGAPFGAVVPPVLAGAGAAARGVGGFLGRVVAPQTMGRLRGAPVGEPPVPPVTGRASPIEGAQFVNEMAPQPATAQDRALRLMADQLLRSGRSVDDVERALAEARRARRFHGSGRAQDTTVLADLDQGLQRLAGAASRAYTEAGQDIRQFVTARQTGITPPGADAAALAQRGLPTGERFAEPFTGRQAGKLFGTTFEAGKDNIVPQGQLQRVRDGLRRAFLIKDEAYHDHRATGLRTVESVVQRAEAEAQKTYGAAFKRHAMLNLRSTIGPVFRRHLDRASMEESTAVEAAIERIRDLFFRKGRPVYLKQFDQVKREIDGIIKDDLSQPRTVHRAGVINALKNDLLDAVDNATGGEASLYRKARGEFSDEMSMAEAYGLGRHALDDQTTLRRTGPGADISGAEITADVFTGLTEGQQRLFRYGLLDALTAAGERKPTVREVIGIFEQPRVDRLIRATIPRSRKRAAEFSKRPEIFGRFLDAERAGLDTRYITQGNSMTARNIQDDMALAGLETVQSVQSFLDVFKAWAAGGTGMGLGQMLLQRVIDRSFGISADAAAELARILFTANPAERVAVLARLREIMPADRMARFTELMRQASRAATAPGAAFGGAAFGAPSADPQGGPVNL